MACKFLNKAQVCTSVEQMRHATVPKDVGKHIRHARAFSALLNNSPDLARGDSLRRPGALSPAAQLFAEHNAFVPFTEILAQEFRCWPTERNDAVAVFALPYGKRAVWRSTSSTRNFTISQGRKPLAYINSSMALSRGCSAALMTRSISSRRFTGGKRKPWVLG